MNWIYPLPVCSPSKGVKRQADTTTPTTGQPGPNGGVVLHSATNLQRRESSRQVKRPKLDLPGEQNIDGRVSDCPLIS